MKKRVTRKDLSFEKTDTGWLIITALVDGHLVRRRYMGYTKRHAAQFYLQEINNQKEAT